jgi:hypothetical protein
MKTMTLKLPDELFAEITSEAKVRNVSKSQIVRERLTAMHIRRKSKSLWNRMEDLVIESDSLPADLSTNRVYLKGYGQNRSDR